MAKHNDTKPIKVMLIGLAIGLVLMVALLVTFYFRVQKPAVEAKPHQPPMATQG
ncbi:hypothetical protein NHF48_001255 [Sphingomonas sp. H160509]|uniref:hypothetical protein n=1 Tax=Sphingomonas sp. H160509 TaxID=2955313 RepID=UPI002096B91A|nr:hypothetical protein [Sphingomonas sp. H160509]MDD1449876.1 hypothetical protein [Sphingomonas sp. H160509]